MFVNYLSFFFYDFWLPFRYLRELSVILLLRFLITLSVSYEHTERVIKIIEEEWQTIHEDTERVIKNRRRRMTDNSRRYRKSNQKSQKKNDETIHEDPIFDYPFSIFVNYLSFFFYDFWLLFRYPRTCLIYISVYLLIPVLACSICNGRTPSRLSCCWRINWH
jgi:ABC-type multidrug transport system fused ATPase/permease subunit